MKRNKFGAKKAFCDHGHKHASGKEKDWCHTLHVKQGNGEIADLQVEPQFWFEIDGHVVKHLNGRRAGYKPDFSFVDVETGKRTCLDIKGGAATNTEASTLRLAFARAMWPEIEWLTV
ncbi:MAG: DUF1064 domain-containing protein [Rhizorhabdus sp.]